MYTNIYGSSAVHIREYEKLFIGSNQDQGYDKPFLGYYTDATQLVLKADTITYFHYPKTAAQVPLSASGLIEAGAVPGSVPHYSDKIWKKQADYEQYINWGNSIPTYKQTGVWLCAWLSGNPEDPTVTPVWKERWYNPGFIDLSGAYHATAISGVILDLDAEMTFDPGVLYRYHHIGNEDNAVRVEDFSTSDSMRLHYDDWTVFNDGVFYRVTDESGNGNNGIIQPYTSGAFVGPSVNPPEKPNDKSASFNGDQHVKVIYDDSLGISNDLSVSFWAYVDDWDNIDGEHIVSRNYRGGWDVKYTNGFSTHVFSVIDHNGSLILANNAPKVLVVKELPGTSRPISTLVDYERFSWILDDSIYEGSKNLFKVDVNGDVIDNIPIDSSYTLLSALDYDPDDAVIWFSTPLSAFGYSTRNKELVSTVSHASPISSFTLDLNKTVVGSTNMDVLVDNDNSTWELSLSGLNKNGNPVFSAGNNFKEMACDSNNNIWTLFGNTGYAKLSTDGSFILSGSVGVVNEDGLRGICLSNEFVTDRHKDFVWITQEADTFVYKLDQNGGIIEAIELEQIGGFIPCVTKNSSSYDWSRKFIYQKYNQLPQIQADLYIGTENQLSARYVASVPTSALTNGEWNMFSLTYSTSTDQFKFYTNSILKETIDTTAGDVIFYDYKNPLIVGGNTGRIDSFGEEIDDDSLYFNGNIDDLRIYNTALNISELRQIYYLKYDYKDLKWDMPTGLQNYLEEIERFFKFKLPGHKSQFFNIRLVGLNITDTTTRSLIEDIIKDTIRRVAPSYTELYKIIWD